MRKLWKVCMMPVLLLTGWTRPNFDKFKKILSCKKIYLVQRAEMRFHRELLKGMHKKGDGPQRRPQGKK